jgi:hypothetical protein
MASGSGFRIKLSSAMRPYVGRVQRNGAIQKAFANEGWVKSLNSCVSSAVKDKNLSGGAIKAAVRECAKGTKGNSIPGFPGSGGKWKLPKSQRGY